MTHHEALQCRHPPAPRSGHGSRFVPATCLRCRKEILTPAGSAHPHYLIELDRDPIPGVVSMPVVRFHPCAAPERAPDHNTGLSTF